MTPISQAKPGSAVRQPNLCSVAKSMEQFSNIKGLSGVPECKGERPSQRDVSSDVS